MNRTMTKEEYVASIKELEEIIAKYREQEKQLKNQYIDENKQFEVNEKVKITTPTFRRAIPDESGRRYMDEECKERDATYAAPLRVKVRLRVGDAKEMSDHEIFMGDLPLMTETGTFVINGAERVIVSQLVRSPGIYYDIAHEKV